MAPPLIPVSSPGELFADNIVAILLRPRLKWRDGGSCSAPSMMVEWRRNGRMRLTATDAITGYHRDELSRFLHHDGMRDMQPEIVEYTLRRVTELMDEVANLV